MNFDLTTRIITVYWFPLFHSNEQREWTRLFMRVANVPEVECPKTVHYLHAAQLVEWVASICGHELCRGQLVFKCESFNIY